MELLARSSVIIIAGGFIQGLAMRKMRIRVAGLTSLLICLCALACFITLAAPGFAWMGVRHVDLEYGDRMRISGSYYNSFWRLRYNQLIVKHESHDDRSRRRNGRVPFYRFVSQGPAIESTHPLSLILNGVAYPIGDMTPDLIRSLGGQVNQPPFKGDSFGHLMIPATTTSGAGFIQVRFREGVPVSFRYIAELSAKPPAGVALSWAGGPLLQLPATEDEIRTAFGKPINRDDRVIVDKTQPPIFYSEPLPRS